jgi:pyrroloquinoline quinone (PQQ) biosynthesis protein C
VFNDIAELRRRWNLLEHPFYVRWSAGELSRAELGTYAGQYELAVVALAAASRHAAQIAPAGLRRALADHAREETEHIELWRAFRRSLAGDPAPRRSPPPLGAWRSGLGPTRADWPRR